MKKTKLCKTLNIKYPIIQGGMVWVSGGKLAAAVANAGGLGVIGAGSMKPDLLDHHIKKAKSLTQNTLAINLPLLYKDIEKQIEIALAHDIKVFITSAGSPKKFTQKLKEKGVFVIHVISNPLLAKKCEDSGVDAVIAEGFEAGGHNGRDELTSLTLLPQVLASVNIPVIAAGGFYNGASILAGLSLGADAIQMGTRFLLTKESSAHQSYKDYLLGADHQSTRLMLKKHIPVRLVRNAFFDDVERLESRCADKDELIELLGKGRAKKGMLLGDLEQGELEAGQICGAINDLPSVKTLMAELQVEYKTALTKILES